MPRKINLSKIETNTPIPAGTYTFCVEGAEEKQSSKGNAYISYKCIVADENHPELNGRASWVNIIFAENMGWLLKAWVAAVDPSADMDDEEYEFDETQHVGRFFRGLVKLEEYNGDNKSVIARFYPLETSSGHVQRTNTDEYNPFADE